LRYPYHQPASRWPSGGFAELTKRKLRRSAYRSVTDLETGIRIRTPACSSRSELKSAGRHYLSGWCVKELVSQHGEQSACNCCISTLPEGPCDQDCDASANS